MKVPRYIIIVVVEAFLYFVSVLIIDFLLSYLAFDGVKASLYAYSEVEEIYGVLLKMILLSETSILDMYMLTIIDPVFYARQKFCAHLHKCSKVDSVELSQTADFQYYVLES